MQSSLRRAQILAEPRGSGDLEVDTEVWNQTLEEASKGWLRGPIPLEKVPIDAPISRRFGLRQKHKIRLIDDFSKSSVNGTVSVFESPVLHTEDVACAAIMHWFDCTQSSGSDPTLLALNFDLSSAYRQVGLDETGCNVAFIRVSPRAEMLVRASSVGAPFWSAEERCTRSCGLRERSGCRLLPLLVLVL